MTDKTVKIVRTNQGLLGCMSLSQVWWPTTDRLEQKGSDLCFSKAPVAFKWKSEWRGCEWTWKEKVGGQSKA